MSPLSSACVLMCVWSDTHRSQGSVPAFDLPAVQTSLHSPVGPLLRISGACPSVSLLIRPSVRPSLPLSLFHLFARAPSVREMKGWSDTNSSRLENKQSQKKEVNRETERERERAFGHSPYGSRSHREAVFAQGQLGVYTDLKLQ